ncbi:MAG: helix-turn-helix transcriptional regulator, partial [Lachnospiraceae bacterium]|nr:helix-turn-helix transcriptional regulator [Lachnospiraceae bacterium]
IRILYVLMDGEKNVSDISEAVEMNQSAVSHQLKTLKTSHLVKVRRDGKAMLYSLADDHVETILKIGMEHISEED